jgi:hypothetical protein
VKDYRKSLFWRSLRLVGVYPHDVNVWRSRLVTLFQQVTFWKFFDEEACNREIAQHVSEHLTMMKGWEEVEASL